MSVRSATMIVLAVAALCSSGGAAAAGSIAVLGAQTRFETDGTGLTAAGEAALGRLVERLVEHGEVIAVRVVGHTDGVGDAAYNLTLSKRRAAYVGEAIARRYPKVPLVVAGEGESMPLASDATPAGRARNRRVEINVVVRYPDPAPAATGAGERR